jgi:hypothetical protein
MPQISTPAQQREWKQKGMQIDPETGMPYGTILRNAEGKYAMVVREGLVPLTEAEARKIIGGFGSVRTSN